MRHRNVLFALTGVIGVVMLSAGVTMGTTLYRFMNGGSVTAVRAAVTSNDAFSTYSTTFIAVPGSAVTVSVPNGQKAILVITFSTEEGCPTTGSSSDNCIVAAYLDGHRTAQDEIAFDYGHNPATPLETRSFQWVTAPLDPGTHTITMAARVDGLATFNLGNRTLTAMRVKA
jgi:hypothetical protein